MNPVASKGSRKARLAELMANGCPTIVEAAYRLRITVAEARNAWAAIKRDLGSQAR